MASGRTYGSKTGVISLRPSTAERTEIAGVIIAAAESVRPMARNTIRHGQQPLRDGRLQFNSQAVVLVSNC